MYNRSEYKKNILAISLWLLACYLWRSSLYFLSTFSTLPYFCSKTRIELLYAVRIPSTGAYGIIS